MKDIKLIEIGKFRLSFAWYDIWIGAFMDTIKRKLYICLIPTLLITIKY
ncbi:MAG: hypothetical protein JEZ09_03575 [Salinivirgaceae bacterium]|nr:hypothetical protein [Salinivirgaceae bacterium]